MILFFKKLNNSFKLKLKFFYPSRGMTFIELIVVLSIFSVMLSISLFNYRKFQEKVDIKNLANDIALKIVEAQKSATSGKSNSLLTFAGKPSYGVYFNLLTPGNNKNFIYFADLNADKQYNVADAFFCATPASPTSDECLDRITLTKQNTISNIAFFYAGGTSTSINDLMATFTRPDSRATMLSSISPTSTVDFVQITVTSPQGVSARIKLFPSGRIQIN